MNISQFYDFIIPIASALVSAIITAMINLFMERRKIAKIKQSYLSPVQIPKGDKRNSIVLIGLGGTGKTTFIKELLQNKDADPDQKTENYEIYHGERSTGVGVNANQDPKNWFYISDYRGQNLSQLVRSFIIQQKAPYSPMAYGYITSLILIVDLWPPKAHPNDPEPTPQAHMNLERVKENNDKWNELALEAIFGILTKELKYVCLLINKIDLMSNRSPESDREYLKAYEQLEDRLRKLSGSAKFRTILGSAKCGTGVNEITGDLIENSVFDKQQ